LIDDLKVRGELVDLRISGTRHVLLHVDMLKELDARIIDALRRLHEQFPLMSSHDRNKVQSLLDYVGDDALVNAKVEILLRNRKLVGDVRRIALAEFKPKLSGNQRKLREKIISAYQEGRFQPPEPSSFASLAGGNAANLRDLIDVCVAESQLVPIATDLFLHTDAETEMRQLVRLALAGERGLSVAEIRDLLHTTRKFAVPLCEYLDRIGVTRRDGDLRFLAGERPVSSES
jgi:selenocysteine-specific elongation factor